MQAVLSRAMRAPENWVISLEYVDSQGVATRRVVSPIRFMPGGRFLGLCLCREEPRQFYLNRCRNIQLRRAEEYVMPVPVTALGA